MRAPIALAMASLALAEWPTFRGPNASGVAVSGGIPIEFGPGRNVVWKTEVPSGASSPVLTRDRVFLNGIEGNDLVTICLDRSSGRALWKRALARPRTETMHKLNSPASSTPSTDGDNVYAFFGDFGLVSYGPDGNERWRVRLGPFENLHGMASSPVVHGGRLIMVIDQDRDSYVAAFDKNSGKQLWRTQRTEVVHGHATPVIFEPQGGRAQIIVPGSYQLVSYDAASGEKLWWVRGLTWQVKTTAVVSGAVIYATGWAPGADAGERLNLPAFESVLAGADADRNGKLAPDEIPPPLRHTGSWQAIDLDRDGFLDARDWSFYRARKASHNVTLAVRPADARGDLTDTHIVWTQERFVPQVSSPLVYQGVLYTVKDGGIFTAFDLASGVIVKQARLTGAIDAYYSSPVAAGGRILVVSENGKAAVIKAGRDWELLGVNDLAEPVYATPALAAGRVFARTRGALYCFAGGDR